MPAMRALRRLALAALSTGVAAAAAVGGWLAYRYHGPHAPVTVYRGVTYGCDRLPDTPESGGLVHWARADLAVPGVGLYVTPTDPDARANGWEYKLRRVSTAVADDGLAAAVNGTLFASDSSVVRLAGDLARSAETAVAGGVANHVDPNTYLLWWDRDGTAHLDLTKPPSPDVLARSAWAIGGQMAGLTGGRVNPSAGHATDARTGVGADPARRLVWVACFDRASEHAALQRLADLGATEGLLVDGGTSTAMALGRDARGVRPGTVTGNWRPVAVQFGFRADPIP